jgi:hypothetical protein
MPVRQLEVIGGLYEAEAPVESVENEGDLRDLFDQVRRSGQRLTIAGARRSLGEQYLPPAGATVVDLARFEAGAHLLETEADGSIWIDAGGGTTFKDLRRAFPGHRAYCPPTTDTVSLAGALSACTHNSGGYFADSVRAFSLLCPNGETYPCSAGASGLPQRLFHHAPGSFGALGVVTRIELRLTPIAPDQQVVVHALYAGRSESGAYLGYLEQAADDPRFVEGAGAVVYGNRGHAIVFGDELLPPGVRRKGPPALLTDDNVGQQAVTQALVNRMPRLAEWLVSRAYQQGMARVAPSYGFQFFQRGFDEAHRRMSEKSVSTALLRLCGVRERMPFCHTAWFFPRAELRAFTEGYFDVLGRYPGIERAVEQQDFVLLGPSRWPSHSMGQTDFPLGVLTVSFGVERGGRIEEQVRSFFRDVTRECRQFSPGARVSLCKQIHTENEVLRSMHSSFISPLKALRAEVDPQGLLTSRLLTDLGLA